MVSLRVLRREEEATRLSNEMVLKTVIDITLMTNPVDYLCTHYIRRILLAITPIVLLPYVIVCNPNVLDYNLVIMQA
jgi:hypothetical protein